MAAFFRSSKIVNRLSPLLSKTPAMSKLGDRCAYSNFLAITSPILPPSGFQQSLTKHPSVPLLQEITVRRMKYKPLPSLKLRCQFCYWTLIKGYKGVLCTRFPRHRQMEIDGNYKKLEWWNRKFTKIEA